MAVCRRRTLAPEGRAWVRNYNPTPSESRPSCGVDLGSVGIDAKQKQQVGMLRPQKTTTFYGRQPGEKSQWSGEAVGPWKPVAPTKVVEVRYDHFGDGRFRHRCTFLRVREDKLPKGCLLEQVVEHAAIQDIKAFIEAGLATAGTKRK